LLIIDKGESVYSVNTVVLNAIVKSFIALLKIKLVETTLLEIRWLASQIFPRKNIKKWEPKKQQDKIRDFPRVALARDSNPETSIFWGFIITHLGL
jgi:hypothetical protein